MGNILDSVFYGKIFSFSSYGQTAELFPAEGGYAGWMHGKVVDMFYVELINLDRAAAPRPATDFLFGPDDRFIFFRPIFNLADAAITIGVVVDLGVLPTDFWQIRPPKIPDGFGRSLIPPSLKNFYRP